MSSPLGQQELLVPMPVRKLIVRRGLARHWGVDPSTQRIAIACGAQVRSHPFTPGEGLARLGDIYEATRAFAEELTWEWQKPGYVLVEQPAGKNTDPILWYAVGVQIAALVDVCEGARVEHVAPASWKKTAVGYGALYKPTRKRLGRTVEFEDYGVAKWARQNGYQGHSWDEADALGIVEAARRTVLLEER